MGQVMGPPEGKWSPVSADGSGQHGGARPAQWLTLWRVGLSPWTTMLRPTRPVPRIPFRALRDSTTSFPRAPAAGVTSSTLEGECRRENDKAARVARRRDDRWPDRRRGHEVEASNVGSVTNAIQSSRRPAEVLDDVVWHNRNTRVVPSSVNQKVYVDSIHENTVTFGIRTGWHGRHSRGGDGSRRPDRGRGPADHP